MGSALTLPGGTAVGKELVFAPTSLTGWTQTAGTWTMAGGVISHTGADGFLTSPKFNPKFGVYVEGEFRCTDASPGTNPLAHFFLVHPSGAPGGGWIYSRIRGTNIDIDRALVANLDSASRAQITQNTWYSFTVYSNGGLTAFEFDGQLISAEYSPGFSSSYFTIGGPNAVSKSIEIRNLKVYRATGEGAAGAGTGLGLTDRGVFAASTTYSIGDVVSYAGARFVRIGSRFVSGATFSSVDWFPLGTSYGSDLASSATITANASEASHGTSLLTDGNDTTYWSDGTTSKPATLTLDFGAGVTKSLRRFQLYDDGATGYGMANTWFVQYSDDNSAWYGAGPGYGFGQPDYGTTASFWRPPLTQNLDNPDVGAHRYWRVLITQVRNSSGSVSDWVRVRRLSVFEAASA